MTVLIPPVGKKITKGGMFAMFARLFIPITAVVFVLAFSGTPAEAQKVGNNKTSATAGTCPIGSCARGGTTYARDVKYCSPKNCKKK